VTWYLWLAIIAAGSLPTIVILWCVAHPGEPQPPDNEKDPPSD
jgi:hypothetical protein